jgi:hypothetical protein
MYVLEVFASGVTRSWGGLSQGLLQFLEFYGRHESVGCLAAFPITIKFPLDISPDGDDTM